MEVLIIAQFVCLLSCAVIALRWYFFGGKSLAWLGSAAGYTMIATGVGFACPWWGVAGAVTLLVAMHGTFMSPVMGLLKSSRTEGMVVITQAEYDKVLTHERLPFRKMFDEGTIGFTVLSTGSKKGDRIWGWDGEPKEGRFLRANSRYEKIVSRTEDELKHLTVADITTIDTLAGSMLFLENMLADRGPDHFDKKYNRTDGSVAYVRVSASVIFDEDTGEPLYYVGQAIDRTSEVSAMSRVQEMLAEESARAQRLLVRVGDMRQTTRDNSDAAYQAAVESFDGVIGNNFGQENASVRE